MISISNNGSFVKTESFLSSLRKLDIMSILEAHGAAGVAALAHATPIESGRTATSWGYTVTRKNNSYTITWTNSDVENGFPVAIMLQYGHGTGNGGYVQGRDYINPAIRPIFDAIEDAVRRAVTSA